MELFAGVGGFRVGLEAVGLNGQEKSKAFEVVYSNQFEPGSKRQHASNVYKNRFGDKGHSNEDIFAVVSDPAKFAEVLAAKPDVLVGGFPCQDYSVAKPANQAAGIEGKKGVLWWSIHRALEQLCNAGEPIKYLVLENVDRLLSSPSACRGRDISIILASLASLGYAVEWRLVNSAEYGFPQRRKRVFLVCYHQTTEVYKRLSQVCNTQGAEGWLTRSCVLAAALPVDAAEELKVSSFEVGQDVFGAQAQYVSLANGKTRFANAGVMLGGRVWTADVKPAAIKDFTAFTGSRTALTLGDVVARTQFVPSEFYLCDASLANWAQLKGAKSKERVSANGHAYTYSEGAVTYPDCLTRPSRTVITGEGGSAPSRTKHVIATADGRLRRLTPEELEQLNGFEPGFTKLDGVSDVRRSFFMGNALVVGIVTSIGRALTARIAQYSDSGVPVTAMNTEIDVLATCAASQPALQQDGTAPGPARLLYPVRFQRFDPKGPYNYIRYSRETIDEVTDYLKKGDIWKEQTLLKWSPQQQPLAMGATVNTKKLAELLVVGHCSARSLVVFLPPEFETHIAEMVSRKPEVCNSTTTDLLHNQTYLVFRAGQGDIASSLWIFDTQIHRDVCRCAGVDGEDEFFAVILVSGNSVAIGGFVCDQDYVDQCQCCSMSAQSYVPSSDEKLAEAALEKKRVGNWPTAYQLHYWRDAAIDLTAPVYRRRSKLGW